jgi:hypothetical protein
VQNILGTTKTVTLPTTKQADNMIISGWQASKVFDGAGNGGDTNTSENKKSSGHKSDKTCSKKKPRFYGAFFFVYFKQIGVFF